MRKFYYKPHLNIIFYSLVITHKLFSSKNYNMHSFIYFLFCNNITLKIVIKNFLIVMVTTTQLLISLTIEIVNFCFMKNVPTAVTP